MRQTKNRKIILDILSQSSELMSAEMIFNKIKDEPINLSTVYRTLEVFLQEELISRTMIDHTAYYYLNDGSHHHYMICLSCHKKFEMDCHLDQMMHEVALTNQFQITRHDVTAYGYCNSCQKN